MSKNKSETRRSVSSRDPGRAKPKDASLAERQAVPPAEKIRLLEKYIGDLTFVAPEIFPDGRTVMERVGQILGMWE